MWSHFNNKFFGSSKSSLIILNYFRLFFCLAIIGEIYHNFSFFQYLQNNDSCYPIEIFQWTDFLPSPDVFTFLIYLLIFSLFLGAIGICTRIALIVSLFLFTYIIGTVIGCSRGIENIYTSWQHCIVVFNLFVMAISPKINQLNLLQLFNFSKLKENSANTSNWTIELLKYHLIISYFAGGVVKIKSGLAWMNGHTLQYYFVRRHIVLDLPTALELSQNLTLMKIFSIFTVVMELAIPIALFTRREIGWIFVTLTLMLQVFCWFVIDLKWMHFYGWAYLIYLIEVTYYFTFYKKT